MPHVQPCTISRRHVLALAPGLLWATTLADAQQPAVPQDETWVDAPRQRAIPVRLRWPAASFTVPLGGYPVVLFSHGLGGTRDGGAVWGEARAAAGFMVVYLQHLLVASLTTDWWRAHLSGDPQARARLAQPPGLMAGDRWRTG